MRARQRLLAVSAAFGISTFASIQIPLALGSSATQVDALPRPSERLAQPVLLRGCGVRVVEWRASAELPLETKPSDRSYAVVDEACHRAFARYGAFLRSRKLRYRRRSLDALPDMSLLPANVMLDGKTPRALNDLPSRFGAVAPSCCYWGLYVDSLNHLFVRNDPLMKNASGGVEANPRFVRSLTHELSHVLSSHLGVWDFLGYDRDRDEELAEAFVTFMGIRVPVESSAEDLDLHRQGD